MAVSQWIGSDKRWSVVMMTTLCSNLSSRVPKKELMLIKDQL